MAKVYQTSLFSWKQVEDLGDLERLELVINNMPDELLIHTLRQARANGRNKNPIAPMWNSLLAGVVFQHKSISSLRRELKRNSQLREMCGFDPLKGSLGVPSDAAYTRFLAGLLKFQHLINNIFDSLVAQLKELLPDLGKKIAFDSKAIASLAKRKGKYQDDQRGEHEADWGKKTYRGKNTDGSSWEKVKSWFGYKLHLIVDADYELPLAQEVTTASIHDSVAIKPMFEKMNQRHPELIKTCEYGMGDKAYDDTELHTILWDRFGIKPVIDIRDMWKDKETMRAFENGPHKFKNVVYDHKGGVFCCCPKTGEVCPMAFGGFEKDRESLKYLCPAIHGGIKCPGAQNCKVKNGLRISLEEDRRVFSPLARSSYKWENMYDKRSSVERVNSRIETSFGFEKHFIRGKKKMEVRCSMALCVMLAVALGRMKQNQYDLMRSLVRVA